MRGLVTPEPRAAIYQSDEFEQHLVSDFTGGLNITDPIVTLPPNQFTSMLNWFYNRLGQIEARPPYRPVSFAGPTQDDDIIIDIDGAGDMFKISEMHDYQVFRETLSNGWSYNDEVHVVSGRFTKTTGAVADKLIVAVYNSTDSKWTMIWNKVYSSVSAVSVCKYKINQAFDLLLFPNVENPERWVPSSTQRGGADIIGDLTDLGLTAPINTDFDPAYAESANTEGFIGTNGEKVYYKFSYFYDDKNVTTKFGESSATAMSGLESQTLAAAGDPQKITISFTDNGTFVPSGVTKIMIYRAPLDSSTGPFKLIGFSEASTAPDGAGAGVFPVFLDVTPFGFDAVEDLQAGSDPSLSGANLVVLNARTVGAYIIGFDGAIKNKLIWSNSGSPDVWNPLNFDYLDDDGKIALEFNRKIYAFTTTTCHQKENMDTAAIKISNIGTVDGDSVQDIGNGLIWMDYDTIYFADFVQQYGSKGDFPKDIGHPIAVSVDRRDSTKTVSSLFHERRYYLTYTDTEDSLQRTYVFDVDISGWTNHSAKHFAWTRGKTKAYSVGSVTITKTLSATQTATTANGGAAVNFNLDDHGLTTGDLIVITGTTDHDDTFAITFVDTDNFTIVDTYVDDKTAGQINITKSYVYEHDYSATVSDSGESEYAGKDYHDYAQVAQTTYTGIANITTSIGRENIKLGGDFRKVFVSSLSIEAEGSVISIAATISGQDGDFSTNKTFASGSDADVITAFAFIFDESVFADGAADAGETGDAEEAGLVGVAATAGASMHGKINRSIKSNAIGILLTAADARGMKLLYVVVYFKRYAAVA